jgi:hypothetical protein
MLVDTAEQGQVCVNRIFEHFQQQHSSLLPGTIDSVPKQVPLSGRMHSVWYITFLDHIELQILTYDDHRAMGDAHVQYEKDRVVAKK